MAELNWSKKHFLLLLLKTGLPFNVFVETKPDNFFQDCLMNRNFKRTAFI